MPLPLAIPIGLAAAGLFSQILGGVKSGQAKDEAQGVLNQRTTDLTSWYDTEKNQDFLQSNLGSSIINRVLQNVQDQNRVDASTAAVTGASDASVLAAKGQTQKQAADVMSEVASFGTQREDAIDARYLGSKDNLLQQQMNLALGEAENAANLSTTGGSLIGAAGPLVGLTKLGGA